MKPNGNSGKPSKKQAVREAAAARQRAALETTAALKGTKKSKWFRPSLIAAYITAAASIVVAFMTIRSDFFKLGPTIELSYKGPKEHFNEYADYEKVNNEEVHGHAKYVSIGVLAKGGPLKKCVGRLTKIERLVGKRLEFITEAPQDLSWAYSDGPGPLDLEEGLERNLNIFSVSTLDTAQRLRTRSKKIPLVLREQLEQKGTYVFTVSVSAEGATTEKLQLAIRWPGEKGYSISSDDVWIY
jgi:hypothetical protein